MMNKQKSKIVIFMVFIMLFSCLVLLCACRDKTVGLSEIYISKDGLPKKTTYVQGQELDLTGGVLTTVNEDGATSNVPMTAEKVTVTGYNKDVTGKQTLTVTYDGKTTTFDVNVVARLSAENFESNYFVGDEFDKTKGKLKIYRDDATSFTVNINDKSVSVLSFDSSKAGKATVSVKCTSTDGKEYTGGFDVTVHAIAEIEFKAPTKNVYTSHEKFDTKGAYFTVKAGGGSNFKKYVEVTESMISGYDPDAVTKANLTEPAKQTVVFSYAGKSFEFPIDVYYSGVLLIKAAAETLSFYDWTDENTKVTEEFGEIALEAIKQYYNLSVFDQVLVDEEDIETVIRPGAIYLHSLYLKEFERYKDVFVFTTSGFALVAKSYEAVEKGIENLENEEDLFNVYAVLLRDIYDEFGDVEYDEKTKLNSKIFVHTEEYNKSVISSFKYMLELYDMLEEIPDEWDNTTLSEKADVIEDTVTKITNSGFGGYQNMQLYRLISAWRNKNDFLEIIYSYYMYVLEGGREELGENVWKIVPLPGILGDWYIAFAQASAEASNMAKYKDSTAYLHDVSLFMHYYFKALDISEDVKNHENPLYEEIYTFMGGDSAMEKEVRGAEFGYLYQMGAGLDSQKILTLWENYLNLLGVIMTNQSVSVKEYGEQFENIFALLVDLSPEELYNFINSLHFLYETSKGTNLVFESKEGVRSYFIYTLAAYYSKMVSESNYAIFQKMLVAMENYALIGKKATALEDFKTLMEEISTDYGVLSDEDQDKFDEYFGDWYDKYMLIYNIEIGKTNVDLGTFENSFTELKNLIDIFNEVLAYINNEDTPEDKKNELVPLLFALYEKIDSVRGVIESSNNSNVIAALSVKKYTFADGDKTLDSEICRIRSVFIGYMINSFRTINELKYRAWDLYSASNVDEFATKIAYLMFQGYKGASVDNVGDVYQIMRDFRAMSTADKNVFILLGFSNMYYAGVQFYLNGEFDNADAVKAVLDADISYAVYFGNQTEENKADFIEKFEALKAIYEALDNKAEFETVFKEIYDYYLEQYNALSAQNA